MEVITKEEIEKLLNIKTRNLSLYQEALIHKSAMKLYNASRSNERLEFIGDSVLNLIVTRYLYDKYQLEPEGFLTKLRTKIVSGKSLHKLAIEIKLNDHIRMNEKAMLQKWNENARILEDTFEAIIGAIYLDMGLLQTKTFILDLIEKYISLDEIMNDNNFKDRLMRYCHSKGYELPVYELICETGVNQNKLFKIQISIEGDVISTGSDKNKKDAEQNAAYNALQKLEK